jgi:hypothetical protein
LTSSDVRQVLVAASLSGIAACATPPGGDPHPAAVQPADAFSMAQPRCAVQGKTTGLAYKEELRYVRIGGQPVYRGASIICE